jgi:hypothetical protein
MDRWVPELFLISLLAAFCGGLAWIHDHELFAAAFAAAAVVAASQARPLTHLCHARYKISPAQTLPLDSDSAGRNFLI